MQLTYDYAPGDHKLDDSLLIQVRLPNRALPEVINSLTYSDLNW